MPDDTRLIERAFPLKQASLDSVHEKNVRQGHISTLHIWPARRPLAASRAALIATLLPDPGTPEARQKLCQRIGGKVVQKIEKKKMPGGRTVDRIREETEGGILHWLGSEPRSGSGKRKEEYRRKAKFYEEELEWFRRQIRKAYGGRAPRVLDPFAGGGAIPLEAMRLGCETTALDVNPVAWFILKCTLEYPQKLAGKTHPLPDFVLEDEEFMSAFYRAHPGLVGQTKQTKKQAQEFRHDLFLSTKADSGQVPEADLAWHVRAWGKWVLDRARRDLATFYPTYADFEPLKPGKRYEKQPMRLVPLREDGAATVEALNADLSEEYLADSRNARWVAKPAVAYLWARTVNCKNCRATVPLLKTRWLCKKANKRVLLTMEPNPDKSGVLFGIETDVPARGGNVAQRREHDKRIGAGTMSRAGAQCPCCSTIMTMEDLRVANQTRQVGSTCTAVVVEGRRAKEYRCPTELEISVVARAEAQLTSAFSSLPFGIIDETIERHGPGASYGFPIVAHGIHEWRRLFTSRQLLAGAVIARELRSLLGRAFSITNDRLWMDAVHAMLAMAFDRFINYMSTVCIWATRAEEIKQTFLRFALPLTWDFAEAAPFAPIDRYFAGGVTKVHRALCEVLPSLATAPPPVVKRQSAIIKQDAQFDLIVTDPPYYDAIPYSDLMDFFYVWLKRTVAGTASATDGAFSSRLSPKWDHESQDGELVDDISRHGGDAEASRRAYESGMARAFSACSDALSERGRLVIVFANKQPDAWESLVGALIRSGFVVDGSWPIITEMRGGIRNLGRASLASSVWLVCKKRPATARPGWDSHVLEDMRRNIRGKLREFWDAGIRGPDFVWAATGPALEAYSGHPVVKKANDPGRTMEVSEFLSQVRRMVVDFVVGQVLTGDGAAADIAAADRMDAPTAYYLLHRHDFGLGEAPFGACILYATGCGLSDRDLESTWDILVRTGATTENDNDEEEDNEDVDPDAEAEPNEDADTGSKMKLKTWAQRKQNGMGYEAPSGQPVPLIDRIHRIMHLWRTGDVTKVDEYLDEHALRRQELFKRLLQSLIELSRKDGESEELQVLESLSNHVQAKGATLENRQATLALAEEN